MSLLQLSFLPERYRFVAKYLIAGCIGAGTQIISLAFFVEVLHVWYMHGVVYAFCIALVVTFTLQKYWTFGRRTTEGMHRESFFYTLFALLSLGLNALLMYVLVERVHIWYLAAEVISVVLLAGLTFLLNKRFTFR
jgi:putative flippase GtrA